MRFLAFWSRLRSRFVAGLMFALVQPALTDRALCVNDSSASLHSSPPYNPCPPLNIDSFSSAFTSPAAIVGPVHDLLRTSTSLVYPASSELLTCVFGTPSPIEASVCRSPLRSRPWTLSHRFFMHLFAPAESGVLFPPL